jgi:hypothetical protein
MSSFSVAFCAEAPALPFNTARNRATPTPTAQRRCIAVIRAM